MKSKPERKPMNPIVKSLIGAAVGAAIGFAMYRFVGCKTGACPINANPWTSMLVWGTLGAFALNGR